MNRAAVAVAVAALLAACGNYSTEDLRFLAALPTRDDLRVAPPADGNAGQATACTNGTADVWLWAKPTSDGLNSGVDFVLSLVDVVRRYPPTAREQDLRRWGPFPDDKHPGRELEIVIVRTFPYGTEDRPVHEYRFEARVVGSGNPFDPILAGTFEGGSSRRGRGGVGLDFQALWDLEMADSTTPHGRMDVSYDRMSAALDPASPVTIELVMTQQGFGVQQFGYEYAGFGDGTGRFKYRFKDASANVLTVATGFDAVGRGRAAVTYVAAGGATGSFSQCWDAAVCLTYVDDPANFTCGAAPCSRGTYPADCVPVPFVGPFPVP